MSGWWRIVVLGILLAISVALYLVPRSMRNGGAAKVAKLDGLGFARALAEASEIDGLSAEQWLEKSRAVYESLSSYRDTGRGYSLWGKAEALDVNGSHTFTTAFDRRGGFRFVQDSNTGNFHFVTIAIWQRPGSAQAKLWWTVGGEIESGELGRHLGAMTGVSDLACRVVYDAAGGTGVAASALELSEPRIVGTGTIDGNNCVMINGRWPKSANTVWIDRSSQVLRRVETQYDQLTATNVLIFVPEIDPALRPDEFDYTPPKK